MRFALKYTRRNDIQLCAISVILDITLGDQVAAMRRAITAVIEGRGAAARRVFAAIVTAIFA